MGAMTSMMAPPSALPTLWAGRAFDCWPRLCPVWQYVVVCVKVDNERNSRDCDRNDGYDRGDAHRATREKG